jgi:hypothetical protein
MGALRNISTLLQQVQNKQLHSLRRLGVHVSCAVLNKTVNPKEETLRDRFLPSSKRRRSVLFLATTINTNKHWTAIV